MAWAPDSPDSWAPDSWLPGAWAPDSERGSLTLARGVELFLTAKAAEGASPKTIEWYRMVLGRAVRDLGAHHPLDVLRPEQLRDWLVTLRETPVSVSVAGYVRGLKAFANWCAAEELAEARALRMLRRPRVPHKLVEPLSDDALRRLLDGASTRDRAILLLFFDTGLRLSELAGLRSADLRPDGSVKVMGKGARERIVPVGSTARQALTRYLRQGDGRADGVIFRSRRGGGAARSAGAVFSKSSGASSCAPASLVAAARTPCVTPPRAPTWSTAAMPSACSASWATPRWTWSSAMSRWRTPIWQHDTGRPRRRTDCSGGRARPSDALIQARIQRRGLESCSRRSAAIDA